MSETEKDQNGQTTGTTPSIASRTKMYPPVSSLFVMPKSNGGIKRRPTSTPEEENPASKRVCKGDEPKVEIHIHVDRVAFSSIEEMAKEMQTMKQKLKEKDGLEDHTKEMEVLKNQSKEQKKIVVDVCKELKNTKTQLKEKESILEGVFRRNEQLKKNTETMTLKNTVLERQLDYCKQEYRKRFNYGIVLCHRITTLETNATAAENKIEAADAKILGLENEIIAEARRVGELKAQVARLEQELADEKKRSKRNKNAAEELSQVKATLAILVEGKTVCKTEKC